MDDVVKFKIAREEFYINFDLGNTGDDSDYPVVFHIDKNWIRTEHHVEYFSDTTGKSTIFEIYNDSIETYLHYIAFIVYSPDRYGDYYAIFDINKQHNERK